LVKPPKDRAARAAGGATGDGKGAARCRLPPILVAGSGPVLLDGKAGAVLRDFVQILAGKRLRAAFKGLVERQLVLIMRRFLARRADEAALTRRGRDADRDLAVLEGDEI